MSMRAGALGFGVRKQLRRIPVSVLMLVAVVLGGLSVAVVVAGRPDLYRYLFAGIIMVNLLALSVRWPALGAIATLLFLPVMALVRRLLIPTAGWTAYDPMLLIGPSVAILLVYAIVTDGRQRRFDDKLPILVMALIAVAVLQAINPTGGQGLSANVVGLLFVGAPLLWFFVGRFIATPRIILSLLAGVVVMGVLIAAYGLYQTNVSFPMWDQRWIDRVGYAALRVGDKTRAFGTFPSSAEYGAFLGAALVACVALTMHRRVMAIVAAPLLAWALFVVSGRGIVVLTMLAIIVVTAVRTGRGKSAATVLVTGIVCVYAVAIVFGPALDRAASNSDDALVQHQVNGLLNPLDPNHSTAIGHWNLIVDGIGHGFSNPLGSGTGSTSLAANRFGGTAKQTEVDISNAFVGFGLVGGFLYLAIVILVFRAAIKRYFATREPLVLAVVGLLVVTFTQWLNGGYYAVSPLVWFLVGWATSPVTPRLPLRRSTTELPPPPVTDPVPVLVGAPAGDTSDLLTVGPPSEGPAALEATEAAPAVPPQPEPVAHNYGAAVAHAAAEVDQRVLPRARRWLRHWRARFRNRA